MEKKWKDFNLRMLWGMNIENVFLETKLIKGILSLSFYSLIYLNKSKTHLNGGVKWYAKHLKAIMTTQKNE